jgi:hypothetical protein
MTNDEYQQTRTHPSLQHVELLIVDASEAPVSLKKSDTMEPQNNLLIKNTFIEVTSEPREDILPRAFSDQSHARRHKEVVVPLATKIVGIPEEASESSSERGELPSNRLSSQDLVSLRTASRPYEASQIHVVQNSQLPMTMTPGHLVSTYIGGKTVEPKTQQPLPVGDFRWHDESSTMGSLSESGKAFTKKEFDGRLSMVTESSIHKSGVYRYIVYIEEGPMSVADGFGFVFSNALPCKKNIQKIDSIFINKKGKICARIHNEMEMLNTNSIGTIEPGSIIELIIDLDNLDATFSLYSPPRGVDPSDLSILVREEGTFSNWMIGTATSSIESTVKKTGKVGHFCAVLKNVNTKLRFL